MGRIRLSLHRRSSNRDVCRLKRILPLKLQLCREATHWDVEVHHVEVSRARLQLNLIHHCHAGMDGGTLENFLCRLLLEAGGFGYLMNSDAGSGTDCSSCKNARRWVIGLRRSLQRLPRDRQQ